jgi:hypothetical protein
VLARIALRWEITEFIVQLHHADPLLP